MVKAQKKADADLVLQLNEQERLKKQAQAVKAYSAMRSSNNRMRWPSRVNAAAAVGMGAQQRRLLDQRGSLDDRFAQQRLDLASQYGDGLRGTSLDEYTTAAVESQGEPRGDDRAAQRRPCTRQIAQADWTNGARRRLPIISTRPGTSRARPTTCSATRCSAWRTASFPP